jgi:two-component system sensor histidine kinase UhpB
MQNRDAIGHESSAEIATLRQRLSAAETTLAEREERLLEVQEVAGLGFYIFDTSTGRFTSSPPLDQLFGIPADFEKTIESWEPFIHPDDRRRVLDAFRATVEERKPFDQEYRIYRHGDHQLRWMHGRGRVQFDGEGLPRSVLGTVQDVTERKQAEEALQSAHEDLEQRVKERTAELAKQHCTLKHLLQASDNERQVVAYDIHDGLAQQLAGAIMQFQTFDARRDARPEDAAAAFDAGMALLRQGHDEARRLISGLRPPVLDESGVVEAIAHLVHEQGRQKGPKIDYHSMVTFDRLAPTLENAVYRICQEAITNAAQHSRAEKVRVSLVQLRNRLRIEVRDWGIGFDAKTAAKGRFGLEGIRQRAKLLGGKCNIRSRPDQGSRVIVELPVVERQEEE